MHLHARVVRLYAFLAKEPIGTATTHSGYDFLAGWTRFHD